MTTRTPKSGDAVVSLTDEYYSPNAKAGRRGVIDFHSYGGGCAAVTFGARVFRPRDGSYVSVSGGPVPSVRVESLRYIGEVEQAFWCWNGYGPGAGNDDPYVEVVALWGWDGVESRDYNGAVSS